MVLHGRDVEQEAIAGLLASARASAGANLVLLGEPGAGKSSLLRAAAADAGDLRVLATSGIESEAPLAFAALQRLLAPLTPRISELPGPQADALHVALGLEAGHVGDRFAVFLGALSLIAGAADEAPVVLVIDDAQWLDEASLAALQFVSRRIATEPVAMLWAARAGEERAFDPGDLPVLALRRLGLRDVAAILGEETGVAVSPEVSAMLLANTDGNPLAVREVASLLTAEQLVGAAPLPERLPVTERLQRMFLDRARRLTAAAQAMLLVAAADDSANLVHILAAGAALGARADALEDLERSGLVTVDEGDLRLRHPLVRSAVYSAASGAERRAAHRALAAVLTSDADADRRAWHLSSSVVGADPAVVAELVVAAERAERRGGHEAASRAWARAAALTTDAQLRPRYLYAAAMAAWVTARPDRARELADRVALESSDPVLVADARRLRGRIEWNTASVRAANRMLLIAAADVAPYDGVRAREIATEALSLVPWGGDSGTPIDPALLVPAPPTDASPRERTYDLMLRGYERIAVGDYQAAAVHLRRAFDVHREVPEDYELLPNLSVTAMHIGEFDRASIFMNRLLSHARDEGALMMALYASTRLTMTELMSGSWSDAASHGAAAVELGEATGHRVLADMPRAVLLLLASLRGDEAAFDELAPDLEEALGRGSAGVLDVILRDMTHWAQGARSGVPAATSFHRMAQMSNDVVRRMAVVDRIESAVRADQPDAARLWVDDIERFADVTGQPWAGAVAAHGRALLAGQGEAPTHFERALELHDAPGNAGRPFNRARTELAYGEHLRRARRRVDARSHLRRAMDLFGDLRARPWAERAAQELRASGETVRRRDDDTGQVLTPQERQVAQLVQRGLSNKDVAAQLFVSPRTVDFHLRNVFTKKGVTSRGELAAISLD